MSRCVLFVLLAALALTARAGELVFWGVGFIGDARAVGIAPNGEIWVGSSDHLTVFSADGAFKRVDARTPGQVNSILFDAAGEPVVGCNSGFINWYEGEKARAIGSFGSYSPWEVALDAAGNQGPLSTEASLIPATPASLGGAGGGGGQFHFTVTGATGAKYVVQASTNLTGWISLTTNTAPFTFVDPAAGNFKQRFYRAFYLSP